MPYSAGALVRLTEKNRSAIDGFTALLEPLLTTAFERRRRIARARDSHAALLFKQVVSNLAGKPGDMASELKGRILQHREEELLGIRNALGALDGLIREREQSVMERIGGVEASPSISGSEEETIALSHRKEELVNRIKSYNREVSDLRGLLKSLVQWRTVLELAEQRASITRETEDLKHDAQSARTRRREQEARPHEVRSSPLRSALAEGLSAAAELRVFRDRLRREGAGLAIETAIARTVIEAVRPSSQRKRDENRPAGRAEPCRACGFHDPEGERFCSACGSRKGNIAGQFPLPIDEMFREVCELTRHVQKQERVIGDLTGVMASARGIAEGFGRFKAGLLSLRRGRRGDSAGQGGPARLPARVTRFDQTWKELSLLIEVHKGEPAPDLYKLAERLCEAGAEMMAPQRLEEFFGILEGIRREIAGTEPPPEPTAEK